LSYGLAGQIVGEDAYVMMVKGDKPGIDTQNAAVMGALMSIKIAGTQAKEIKSEADLEAMLRKQVDGLAGSVSVAIVHQDKIVYTYVYGEADPVKGLLADPQTIYKFGSMTKMVTASALMQLEEQGRVDLDAWPGKYIPEFPKRWNVTVRQLLDHSDCMPDIDRLTNGLIAYPGESFAPLEEVSTNYVKDYPDLVCEPGKASAYANPPYLALARLPAGRAARFIIYRCHNGGGPAGGAAAVSPPARAHDRRRRHHRGEYAAGGRGIARRARQPSALHHRRHPVDHPGGAGRLHHG
jgi:hypothetical protein